MNKVEIKARLYLYKRFPNAYIFKVPDYKSTGSSLLRGLPDYIVVDKGVTYWFEIKYINSLNIANIDIFTEAQMVVFKQLLRAGLDVNILLYSKDFSLYDLKFSEFLDNPKIVLTHRETL